MTGELQTTPVLVVRGWDHVLRAFENLCRHQHVQLEHDEHGHCTGIFTCPFHGWTYDIEGRALSPAFDDDSNLKPLAVSIREDGVWVGRGGESG